MGFILSKIKYFFDKTKKTYKELPDHFGGIFFEFIMFSLRGISNFPFIGSAVKFLSKLIGTLLCSISPSLPLEVQKLFANSKINLSLYVKIFFLTAFITLLFSLVFTTFISFQSGTLIRSNIEGVIGFLDDTHNIILYSIVVPIYVGCCVCLIIAVILNWKYINKAAINDKIDVENYNNSIDAKHTLRIVSFFTLSLFISSFFISNYIDELKNVKEIGHQYWFFSNIENVIVLNKAGAYYLFLNTMLLLITSFAALCYISISIEAFRLGRNLEKSLSLEEDIKDNKVTEAYITSKEQKFLDIVEDFAWSYFIAKILILVYIVNILIWQDSPAGKVSNVHVAIFVLFVIGIFFVALPRLYLSSRWHSLKLKYMNRIEGFDIDNADIISSYRGIERRRDKKLSLILNVMYISLAIYVLNKQYPDYSIVGLIEFILQIMLKK